MITGAKLNCPDGDSTVLDLSKLTAWDLNAATGNVTLKTATGTLAVVRHRDGGQSLDAFLSAIKASTRTTS